MKSKIELLTLEYFSAFKRKDVKSLEQMMSQNVTLRDWEISASGIEEVLRANQDIFDKVDKLDVEIEKIHVCGSSCIAQIKILANDDTILVADFIEYDEENKIKSVTAYKG